MRQITLTNRIDRSTTPLQWDEATGKLFGDKQDIAEILFYTDLAVKEGSWSLLPTYHYPIQNPLHNALEFAVILNTLDDYISDLELPEVEQVDGWVRDESGNVIDQVVF